jgi:hypothetical protein
VESCGYRFGLVEFEFRLADQQRLKSLRRQRGTSATIVVGFKPMGTVHNCRVRLPMRSHWREAQSGHTNRSSCTAI